ncbi:MAG: hypothetical protein GXO21_02655 [Aquificae bacterium]|nr:hypothetical protein [Aquificota bacterium]
MANYSYVSLTIEGDINRIRDFVKKLKYDGKYSIANLVDEEHQAEVKIFKPSWIFLHDFKAKKVSDNKVKITFDVKYLLPPVFYQYFAIHYPDLKMIIEEFNEGGYYSTIIVENGKITENFTEDFPLEEEEREK